MMQGIKFIALIIGGIALLAGGLYSLLAPQHASRQKIGAQLCIILILMAAICLTADIIDELASYDHTERRDLMQINYTEQTEGSYHGGFTYGRGSFKGVEYYVVYEVQEDGSLLFEKYACESTPVYPILGDGDTAYIEFDVTKSGIEYNYKLYVPENSIIQEYDLSLNE